MVMGYSPKIIYSKSIWSAKSADHNFEDFGEQREDGWHDGAETGKWDGGDYYSKEMEFFNNNEEDAFYGLQILPPIPMTH